MPVERFRRQVEWVLDHWTVVSVGELLERLTARHSVRGLASLTFDDAYSGFLRWALPVLRAFNLPSSVFVIAGAAEDPRSFWWDHPEILRRATPARRRHWLESAHGNERRVLESERLATAPVAPDCMPAGWSLVRACLGPDLEVGAHTVEHQNLPALKETALRDELEQGRHRIEQALGVTPRLVAYPYGATSPRVREAALAAGYDGGLTLTPRLVAQGADPWAIPRIAIPGQITDAAFEAWASGLTPVPW